ncbi:hypothetical protein P8452_24169 [Trifolium repens]|nr:hypothetical protein P8452_24169 [Trifolium repens]
MKKPLNRWVYAPVVGKETTFHRILFVFMCPSMTCLVRDQHEQWKRDPEKLCRSVKIFRCQLPRNNPFYSSECPKFDGSDKPTGSGVLFHDTLFSTKRQALQLLQTSTVLLRETPGHKIACQQIKVSSSVCGPNKNGTTRWNPVKLKTKARGLNSRLLKIKFSGDDDKKSWAHFQEHIAKAPEQVLRYYRNSNSKTIWPILSGRPSKDDIPKCIYCGGSMCCEFQ